MDATERQRFAGRLLVLAKALQPLGAASVRIKFGNFGLDPQGAAELDKTRSWLLRENGWASKYSEKHLTAALADAVDPIQATLAFQDALKAATSLEKDWLAYSDTNLVYLPIENVQMTLVELKIGRVRLTRVTPKVRRDFEASIRNAFASSKVKRAPSEIDERVALALERLDHLGNVVSIVEINAEPIRAHEFALVETRRVLDFLNYASSAIWGLALRRAAGISGDAFRGVQSHLTVKNDFTRYSSQHDFGQGIAELIVDSGFKGELTRLGLTKTSRTLTSTNPSDLEEAVIEALHWYSDSWVQSSVENELLGLVTALETIFTQGRGGITAQVSESVAFVLGQDLEGRKLLVERVRHLYGLRGKVTHGEGQQILAGEVNELRHYVLNVINELIRNPKKWDSRKALRDWIDDQHSLDGFRSPLTEKQFRDVRPEA